MHILLLTNPFFQAYTYSDLFGRLIFWSLFLLSAISWIVLIYKIRLTRKIRSSSSQFEKFFDQTEDTFHVQIDPTYKNHPYFEIYNILKQRTIDVLNKNRFFLSDEKTKVYLSQADIELVESHTDQAISSQTKFLEKNLFLLPTIVTLAPFLGLLGTVWGILLTFSHLNSHTLMNNNNAILSGLSMALATTVIGLVVAIPALVANNYLKSTIRDFTKDMEHFSHRLLSKIEMQYRRVDIK